MKRIGLVLLFLVALLWLPSPASAADDVTFTGHGGVTLHGTIHTPPGAQGRRPGIVLLEGAGNRGRSYLRAEAEAYARHGIVVLSYDKRTEGYSTLERDYSVLADDALAAVRTLQKRPDVDPARVGLWALSEGAFVAPIAAGRSSDVAFVVTVGAVGVTPGEQTAWAYGEYLAHAGVTGHLARTLETTVLGTAIEAGLFPEVGFDPVPYWENVRQPVLAQWGEFDRDSVPGRSSRLIASALDRGGNTRHSVRIVPEANHNLHTTADAGFDRLPALPAGYGDVEAAWIADFAPVPAGSVPAEATVPDPARHGTIWALVAAVVILVLALAGGFRWLAVLAPLTVLWTLVYLLFLLVTAGKVTGPVLLGTPVAWLVAQGLAVGTIAAAGFAVRAWWRGRSRVRLGLAAVAGVAFVPWAAYWGLLWVG